MCADLDDVAAAGFTEGRTPRHFSKARSEARPVRARRSINESVSGPAGGCGSIGCPGTIEGLRQIGCHHVRGVALALMGLIVVIATLSPAFRAEAATPAEIRQALDAAISSSIQTTLPEEQIDPLPPEPEPPVEPPEFGDLSALGEVLRVLLWVLVAAGVALVVFSIVTGRPLVSGRAGGRASSLVATAGEATGDGRRRDMVTSLTQADRLAAEGAYAEALHMLLHFGLAEMRRAADGSLSSALTSREVLRRPVLSDDARAALSPLVDAVEISHFGGRQATADDYRACRAGFHRFAELVLGGAA